MALTSNPELQVPGPVPVWHFSVLTTDEKVTFFTHLLFSALFYVGFAFTIISLFILFLPKEKKNHKKYLKIGLIILFSAVYIFLLGLAIATIVSHALPKPECLGYCYKLSAPWYGKILFFFGS